jgi:hypothetical protein
MQNNFIINIQFTEKISIELKSNTNIVQCTSYLIYLDIDKFSI